MGRRELRNGNRAPGAAIAPYNAYPARDGYVLILGADDQRWQRLCGLMDRPELAHDPRFASVAARAQNQDALDAAIAQWTRTRSKQELMDTLNGAGVFCGVVKEFPEVMTDPHLHERGMLCNIDHSQAGHVTVITSPLRLGAEPPVLRSPSPAVGADNEEIFGKLLGLGRDQIAQLRDQGVI